MKRTKRNKVITAFKFTPKLLDDLRAFSKKDHRTMTAVVERAICAHIYRKQT